MLKNFEPNKIFVITSKAPKYVLGLFFIIVLLTTSLHANEKDKWSFSVGQFDINDNIESFETRFEYLYARSFYQNRFDLKQFLGVMSNSDDAIYLYSGLRKEIQISKKWNFTPSFAPGYYEKGQGKDLGSVLEFKSEIKVGFDIFENSKLSYSYSHISNNDWGDTNPGTDNQQITFSKNF